jgi:hypothetical protein
LRVKEEVKSSKGIATPKPDMNKIRDRLKLAEQHASTMDALAEATEQADKVLVF